MNPEAHNPYAAPLAALDVPAAPTDRLLYVVAPTKLLIMMIGTAGIYLVYWFYRNWAGLNTLHRAYWPVPRAIFSIFFTHSLFREVEQLRVRRGRNWDWQPATLAWIYVASLLVPNIINATVLRDLPGPGMLVGWIGWIPMFWVVHQAQRAINVAEGDPEGRENQSITGANVGWLVAGALFWLMQIGSVVILMNPALVGG